MDKKYLNTSAVEDTIAIVIQNNLKTSPPQYYKGVLIFSFKDKEAVTHGK